LSEHIHDFESIAVARRRQRGKPDVIGHGEVLDQQVRQHAQGRHTSATRKSFEDRYRGIISQN
jgi:hypothetical protein